MNNSIYDFSARQINGEILDFNALRGKVLLIVNTASRCGFTYQYTELETLYQRYHSQGLEILAFPCNQFLHQEPWENNKINKYCQMMFNLSFQLMEKIEVNGVNTHPLFQYLKTKAPGFWHSTSIKWNFTKFLVNRNGNIIVRFPPYLKPLRLEYGIQSLLEE